MFFRRDRGHSERDIRQYVERELDRTIRANHPDLRVVEGHPRGDVLAEGRPKPLLWSIESHSGTWAQDYVIEARVGDGELLVWYGYSSAGAAWTHHLMRPAVHLSLRTLDFLVDQYASDAFTLGAVLEWMLASHDPDHRMPFPMNNYALT